MDAFSKGYAFFTKNSSSYTSAALGDYYVSLVGMEIDTLVRDLNSFCGSKTDVSYLKGDIAEFWHSDTFNIHAVARSSASRTQVERSHELGSPDITSNFGEQFGLKYYNTGKSSAKAQAMSINERYMKYRSKGGKVSFEEYVQKISNYSDSDVQSIGNDPLYKNQKRIIPKGQSEDAKKWLTEKINSESSKRADQVERYKETRSMINERVEDGKGVSSISLSDNDSKLLANLAKKGEITEDVLKRLGVSTEEIIQFEYILRESFKSGTTAAIISTVLAITPEIYKAISFLIQNGEVDRQQFKNIGFAALQGSTEGFIRGCISAAITSSCKAGLLGESLKNANPSVVAAITVIAMDTMKNAFKVVVGEMERQEVVSKLIEEVFIATCSLIGGGISQAFIELPILGFMLGSFIGSIVGSFTYKVGYEAILSFCVDSGFTMFGLVDQNYELPDNVLDELGIDFLQYEQLIYHQCYYHEFEYDKFTYSQFQFETLNIRILRRGVIGVSQIGYM